MNKSKFQYGKGAHPAMLVQMTLLELNLLIDNADAALDASAHWDVVHNTLLSIREYLAECSSDSERRVVKK